MAGYRRMMLNALALVPGLGRLPAVQLRLRRREVGTGGTNSARYCYSVWLRHLTMAGRAGLATDPRQVAELGPGDSIGAGLAALISGAESYTALDVVSHVATESNLRIFDELVELFAKRSDIPDAVEFPSMGPRLEDYRYPAQILGEERMRNAMQPGRLARIRESILGADAGRTVRYRAPWLDAAIIERESQDVVFSQAVLEHVDLLPEAYRAMRDWLRPTGWASHQIDFRCHGWADAWDGHWCYGDLRWKLLRGDAAWFINRQPYSEHLRLLAQDGFRIVAELPVTKAPAHDRGSLAERFRSMPESDRSTSEAYVLAVPSGR